MGSGIDAEVSDPPSPEHVASQLGQAGYFVRPDVVDYFSWRSFPDFAEAPRRSSFFYLTNFVLSVERAIELQQFYAAQRREFELEEGSGEDDDQQFPGPSHFLPLASARSQVLLSIDCRPDPDGGAVELWDIQGPGSKRCFESLPDAIATATYCLATGIWEVDERNDIRFVPQQPQDFPAIVNLQDRY